MTKLSLLSGFFLLSCGVGCAQYTRTDVFLAPGGLTSQGSTLRTYDLGGGAERLLSHGAGVGAELEGIIPGQGVASHSVGIFSINGYYHFLHDRKLDPFVTAGYSLLFRDYTENMFNYGGGMNYWFKDNLGLLLEFRDHVGSRDAEPTENYWAVRIGLSFR